MRAPCRLFLWRHQEQGLPWQRARGHPVAQCQWGHPRECKPPHCAGNKRRGRPGKGQGTAPPAKRQRGRLTASATPSPAPDLVAAREARLKSLKDQRHRAYTQLQDARQQVTPCVHLCSHCGDKFRQHASRSCSKSSFGAAAFSWWCLAAGLAVAAACNQTMSARHQVHSSRGDCTYGTPTRKSLIRTCLNTQPGGVLSDECAVED